MRPRYDWCVPRYLVVRKFTVAEGDMPTVGRKSRETIDQYFPEISWEHSHVVVDADAVVWTYCVYGAPDEETVRQHSQQLGNHAIESMHEIAGDVSPADFPP